MITEILQKKYLVLTGNYGSGKTEIALNIAFAAAKQYKTTLVDLDIVNPYFRSGEKAEELKTAGISLLMPTFALTTVDIPALPPEIQSVFDSGSEKVIFDVGGDDTGAAALGRYYPSFMSHRDETTVALVVNCMRPLTGRPEEIIDLAQRIVQRGRLKIDMIINNTNIASQTTPKMAEEGEKTVLACAEALGIGCAVSAAEERMIADCRFNLDTIPVKRYMVPEWMDE